ncbi:MFS transporter [Ammoniphilus sp. YIM 78166]|uniref:MFS transporter n=1 Tax=Ammoniphilus sp. YIM 78166 TaxID=1644106 RepID=UPI00142FA163|nr:MFS transporter [Ammoniphilus sp. YIM 78166]
MKAKSKGLINLPLMVMYLDTLLMAIGFFMLVPLLGVYFIDHLAWSAALSGFILSISGLSQNGLKFFCGIAADRMGFKNAILLGVAIRAGGFSVYGFVEHPLGFAAAAFVSGLGGAMFHPASYAAYAKLAEGYDKQRIYAIREWLSNIGFILGPVIGMFLLKFDFTFVSLISALMFLLSFIVTFLFLPPLAGEEKCHFSFHMVSGTLGSDRRFLVFTLLSAGVWAIYVQLYLAVPVRTTAILDDASVIGYLYMTGAIFMVVMQLPVIRWLESRFAPLQLMAGGTFFLGLGLFCLGWSSGMKSIITSILVFTFGQMIAIPVMNGIIATFANASLTATYFGFQGLGLAIGGVAGNTIGGVLYDWVLEFPHAQWVSWSSLFIYSIILSGLLMLAGRRS